jgi:ubiquinone/menaquinone biosynthesis C-methylase UbiE
LGCGTGRVTIPLAEAGFSITGIDHSASMLEIFGRKLEGLPLGQRNRITLVQGDMANFGLSGQFDLIFIPFRSFQALTRRSEQEACLACVKRHLAPGGEFILDVFRPKTLLDASWVRAEQEDWTTLDPRTGRTVSRHSAHKAIDTKNQVLEIEMRFVISDASGQVDEFTEPLRLSYFYEGQLVSLVASAGLQVSEKWGYYDGTPIDRGSEFILTCEHR